MLLVYFVFKVNLRVLDTVMLDKSHPVVTFIANDIRFNMTTIETVMKFVFKIAITQKIDFVLNFV